MPRNPEDGRKATILVPLAVMIVVGAFFLLGCILTVLFRLPFELGLSPPFRLLGVALVTIAVAIWIWLLQYRRPTDVLISTYATFSKLLRRAELKQDLGRKERLVVRGPYKWVRHPMYLAVLLSIVGWGLLLDLTFILLAALVALPWFNFVVMPYEEKELVALFGRDYEDYMKRVHRLLPIRLNSTGREQVDEARS